VIPWRKIKGRVTKYKDRQLKEIGPVVSAIVETLARRRCTKSPNVRKIHSWGRRIKVVSLIKPLNSATSRTPDTETLNLLVFEERLFFRLAIKAVFYKFWLI